MICFLDLCLEIESLCVALEAVSVALWTALLQSVHWLYVYSHRFQMSVLVNWVGLKVLYGALFCMYVDMVALQCR